MSHVRIRKFSLSDLERIMEIENASFGIEAFSRSTFKILYKETDLFLVAESSVVVGYIVTYVFNEVAHIISIAIDPAYRRKGIGKMLIEYTFDRLKGRVKYMQLEVKVSNMDAIRFWEKLSFSAAGIIPNYYIDGSDALCMGKSLE